MAEGIRRQPFEKGVLLRTVAATPVGLGRIIYQDSQGSPRSGPTLGWMMKPRWGLAAAAGRRGRFSKAKG